MQTKLFKYSASPASLIAFLTSLNLPTPLGSIKIRSGLKRSITSFNDDAKSPARLQQMHPCDNSLISIFASAKKSLSTLTSPNSFSISTNFSFVIFVFNNRLIKVVFPAPKKPETISILTYIFLLSSLNYILH